MLTPFLSRRRVEFGETDMAGIMHFSNFFRFMESAETDFLHARGLSVSWQGDGEKLGFPRVSASCEYRRPARFEDVLEITVVIEKIGLKSVSYRYEFRITGSVDPQPIAVGRMTCVFCRSAAAGAMESLEIPADLRAKLES